MAEQLRKSWFRRKVEDGLRRGFQHAYETVKVDPNRFLLQLRAAYGVPINSFQGIYSVEVSVLDDLANRVIHSGMKLAAAEGAGLRPGWDSDHAFRISAFWPASRCEPFRSSA